MEMTDSSALRSVLSFMEDSQPKALVALAQAGTIKRYLATTADQVIKRAKELAETPHPDLKDRKLGWTEAEMQALQEILPISSEEEDPDPDDLRAAVKVADRLREMLEAESEPA